ncbi:MAG TPA: ABC transporter substrate-binding protein [Candidatus Sulfotelmatobacter sp.]|nr:ABC transporter substrate-binding protein [Candidatus Sulfotelmatobacter sp.]
MIYLAAHKLVARVGLYLVVALTFLMQTINAAPQEYATMAGEAGDASGNLIVALRSEPKTLNPVLSVDATSREVIGAMQADLIHINRETQRTEPALAKSWTVSPDGKTYVLQLRHGLKFSDGAPFTADDVVFSFELYLDEKLHSPQRDLLVIDDKPITVKKLGAYSVEFDLPKPYGPGERLFDGLAILPKHLLEKSYREGKFPQAWGTAAQANELAGLGPFVLKSYEPGQQMVLQRNANYWKKDSHGNSLPYLSQLVFVFVPNEDAQVIKFQAGETHVIERLNADNFSLLLRNAKAKGECLRDLGPGLEIQFLVFNQNTLDPRKSPDLVEKQAWFRDLKFRQAVSLAMDRKGMARLVYAGRATPIWGNVSPGNKLWLITRLPHPERSIEEARKLLQSAGYSWDGSGNLLDPRKKPITFTIIVSSSNTQRAKLAALAQDDLRQLGMNVQVVPTEFRALVDRLLNTKDYEAVLMNLVNGDADPTPEMNLWLSSGETHLWDLGEAKPATPWEAELDRLMEAQMTTSDFAARKHLYDRVQEIVAQNLPFIFLISPNILVGAQSSVGNFRPGILEPYALWNAEQFFLRRSGAGECP